MLTGVLAHVPGSASELWTAWPAVPFVWFGFGAAAVLHARARRRPRRRTVLFGMAMAALGVALATPLESLSHALASAHMAQHLLLIAVAAPLLAAGAAPATLAGGLPPRVARRVGRARRAFRARPGARVTTSIAALAGLHVAVLWFWHAAGPYDAAVHHRSLHALEHATLLVTAVAAWAAVLGRAARRPARPAAALLALFALSLQSAVLGALLTFAPEPWYDSYAGTTSTWGLSRLADQQLAGVLMWVPGGIAYLAAALHLLVRWLDAPTASTPIDGAATSAGGERHAGHEGDEHLGALEGDARV